MTQELLEKSEKLFIENFSDFYEWLSKFLNFPRDLIKIKKEVFDYVSIDYIHINRRNLEGVLDTRCTLTFYTDGNCYKFHIVKPYKKRPSGLILGTFFVRDSEHKLQEGISSNLIEGAYSENTWRETLKQIVGLEGRYPKFIMQSKA